MKPILLYIHGLGSDKNSRKFLNLKEYFQDHFEYDFLEWKNDSDIRVLIDEKFQKYKNTNGLIIVGDSTGANYAYQLREIRSNEQDILVLTSPLLDIERRIASYDFPKSLGLFLNKISEPRNTTIIAAKNDEIIDQKWLFENYFEELNLIEVDDNHRLEKFLDYLPMIEFFIK